MSKNVVLIGMPGCGKTTLGKIISKNLGFKFFDADQYIEEKSGKVISQLFDVSEDYFRSVESEVVHELSKEKSSVISTGGGVIKKHINIERLKETGVIIFIDRPVENIASDVEVSTRPLLKDGVHKLYELFNERYDIYKKCCDFHVMNDSDINETVKRIIGVLK
jgi:Shikimate kinase